MRNQQTVLTALGCAGSLAAMLAVSGPAIASPISAASPDEPLSAVPGLAQDESNPIIDALGCTCARCTIGEQQPTF
ncbi:MAG: hypothetical protein AAFV85_24950 [Cyanobacteria bacterium J06634_6]